MKIKISILYVLFYVHIFLVALSLNYGEKSCIVNDTIGFIVYSFTSLVWSCCAGHTFLLIHYSYKDIKTIKKYLPKLMESIDKLCDALDKK